VTKVLGRFGTFYAQYDTMTNFKEADKIIVLKRFLATTLPFSKLQPAAKPKRQTTSNGNNDSGNGNGNSGSNNGDTNSGGGSSTTDRNKALGVGLVVGIPTAIVAVVQLYLYFVKRDRGGENEDSMHIDVNRKKKGQQPHRSTSSQQNTGTQPQGPELWGVAELGNSQG
jgi:hypothetical protein